MTTEKQPPDKDKPNNNKKKKVDELSPAAVTLQRTIAAIKTATGLKPFDAPDSTIPHVPTGSTNLDMLIGGSLARDGKSLLCPGFPRRRITEVYGPESSGKTTLLLSSIAQLQRNGGSALLVDFEHHISKKYAIDIGVDWDAPTFEVIQPRTLEEGLKAMFMAIMGGVDLVGVDSVAAMVPKSEMAKKFDDPAKIGAVAAAFSTILPRFGVWLDEFPKNGDKSIEGHPGTAIVLLNQTRALIQSGGGGHGDSENTAGGKALKFYASLRIRMSRIKGETLKRKDPMSGREVTVPFGNLTYVKIVKSKLDGKQNHSTQLFIRFGYGIDDYLSIIEAGIANKLIKKAGTANLTFNGQQFFGRDKLRKHLMADNKAFEELKAGILSLVMAGSKPLNPNEELGENDEMLETMAKELGDLDDEDEDGETGMGAVPEEVIEDPDAGGEPS